VNPGLARRFAIENAFRFEDFNDDELREILNYKLKAQDLSATDLAKDVAIEVLSRSRNRPNFGNAGELENLLSVAKNNHQKRMAQLPFSARSAEMLFEPQDFDPEYQRSASATSNLKEIFKDVIGCEKIVKKLEGYQRIAHASKQNGRNPRDLIPTNFVFKGPPGLFPGWHNAAQGLIFGYRYRKNHYGEEDGQSLFRHGLSFIHRGC
jgi:hypothetical protein